MTNTSTLWILDPGNLGHFSNHDVPFGLHTHCTWFQAITRKPECKCTNKPSTWPLWSLEFERCPNRCTSRLVSTIWLLDLSGIGILSVLANVLHCGLSVSTFLLQNIGPIRLKIVFDEGKWRDKESQWNTCWFHCPCQICHWILIQ